jgi:hypothetical protein
MRMIVNDQELTDFKVEMYVVKYIMDVSKQNQNMCGYIIWMHDKKKMHVYIS